MVEQRFVDKIAARYIELYRVLGHAPAIEYADRMLGEDATLHERVRIAAEKMLQEGKDGKAS